MWEMWNHFAIGLDLGGPGAELESLISELPASVDTVVALGALAAQHLIHQTPDEQREAIRLADEAIALAAGWGTRSARRWPGASAAGPGSASATPTGWARWTRRRPTSSATRWGPSPSPSRSGGRGRSTTGAGPRPELSTRRRLSTLAEQRGLSYMTSFSVAEEVRCLAELGRLREAVALAETVHADDEAQPRWAVVARALALADLGELDAGTVAEVAATPPASPDDLRHVLGSMLVAGTWAPAEVPALVPASATSRRTPSGTAPWSCSPGSCGWLSTPGRRNWWPGCRTSPAPRLCPRPSDRTSAGCSPAIRPARARGRPLEEDGTVGRGRLALLDLAELRPERGPDAVRAWSRSA